MLPIMLRANEEAMFTVSDDLWEAGLALGSPRARVVRSVVLRGALPGIVTGNLLAMARAIGETAPLIFTIFGSQFYVLNATKPMDAMPLSILDNATQAYPSAQQTAWGTALVLMVLVVVLSAAARLVASYLNRKTR
jgi:phosphate transport system permease protein